MGMLWRDNKDTDPPVRANTFTYFDNIVRHINIIKFGNHHKDTSNIYLTLICGRNGHWGPSKANIRTQQQAEFGWAQVYLTFENLTTK